MKKLKKALCLLLCAAVCLSLLAACAEAPQQNQSPVSQDESAAAPAQPPAATVDLSIFCRSVHIRPPRSWKRNMITSM